jgi:hypothetical protein
MTNTERKLNEARYFFTLLDINDPYFDYILSAFLNAARSIGWVMRHEYNKVEGWEEWFNHYYLSEDAKHLLKKINELRIEATKKAGVKTDFFFFQTDLFVDEKYYPELKKIKDLEDGEYLLSIVPTSEDEPKKIDDAVIHFEGEINRDKRPYIDNREKLQGKCAEYLKLMTEVVTKCSKRFII